MLEYLASVWSEVTSFFSYWYNTAYDLANRLYVYVNYLVGTWWGKLVDVFDWTWWLFRDLIDNLYYRLKEYVNSFAVYLRYLISTWWGKLVDVFDWTWWLFRDLIDNLYNPLKDFVTNLLAGVREYVGKLAVYLRYLANNWWSKLVDVFDWSWGIFRDFLDNLYAVLKYFVANLWGAVNYFFSVTLPRVTWMFDQWVLDRIRAFINDPGLFILGAIEAVVWPWLKAWLEKLWFPHIPYTWE